jgi:hypothetical protein
VFQNRWIEVAAGFALLAAFWLLQAAPLSHDIAWCLWIGRQLSHGVGLYSEVVELNPPLWFWLTVPIVRVADLIGVPELTGLVAFFALATGLSLGLLAVLVREHSPAQRAWMYAVLGLGSVALLVREFGQREQYVLLTTAPYVALIARRAQGRETPAALAILVALFAASGFALKPYFALAPLFLEGWYFLTARRSWRPWRPEWIVLGVCAAGYAAAIVAFSPDYLRSMAPMARLAYGAYNQPFSELLTSELAWPAGLGLLGVLVLGHLVAAAAFTLAFVIQGKGWFYHGIPATGLLLFGIAAEASTCRWSALSIREKVGFGLLAWAFFLPLLNVAVLGDVYHNRFRTEVTALIADLPPGASVMAFSSRSTFIWPMVEERRLLWPSRYYTFWMLPAIVRDRASGHPTPALAQLARTVQAETLQDLRCNPPARILVHDAMREARDREIFRRPGFDYLDFFREDPGIAELLTHYAPGPRGAWRTYDLVDPAGMRPPLGPCRRVY